MSKKKLNNIAKDTNKFLVKYLKNQKRTDLIKPMSYGLLPGGKKIRSKIIYDIVGYLILIIKQLLPLDLLLSVFMHTL